MKKIIVLVFVIVISGLTTSAICQDTTSIAQKRKDNLIKLLNYRFKGGYYSFEKVFQQSVSYPPIAQGNCIMGIAIVSFRVSCKGELHSLIIKTRLGYGIDNEITSFFAKTEGMWNTCNDEKYTRFEIPIQFRLSGTDTNNEDALLVLETENPGYLCNNDEYYIKKLNKYIEKGKKKKILQYLEILTRRDPYNSYYQDLRKKTLGIE